MSFLLTHNHLHHDKLAQVMVTQTFNGITGTNESIAIPLANELRSKYGSDISPVALVYPNFTHTLAAGDKKLSQSDVWAEPDLPEMLTFHMLKGSRDVLKDPSSVLLAASVAKALFKDADPLYQTVRLDNMTDMKVAGVFEDLPQNTSFASTKLFLPWEKAVSLLNLKESSTQWDTHYWKLYVQLQDHADIDKVNAAIRHITRYQFVDQEYAKKFSDEERIGRLATIFAVLAILISLTGLFGLASFVAEQRTKEIGVRKVLGASVFNLWKLLSEEFVLLVFISCLIAGPLAWYFLNRWLSQYAFRTPISWWIFVLAAAGSMGVALLTVSFHSIRAAVSNPVNSLRSE